MNSEAIESLIKKNPSLASKREKLESFRIGASCEHGSWGFGKIVGYDKDKNRLIIDFDSKKGHSMDPAFCVDKLKILEDSDLLVEFKGNPKAVEEQMKKNPADFVAKILESFDNFSCTTVELENALRKFFSDDKEFRTWWNKTKKVLARDPRIACPKNKKTDSFVLRAEEDEMKPEQEILQEYFLHRDPKRKILLAEKLYHLVETSGDKSDIDSSIAEIKSDLPRIEEELTNAIKSARTLKQADKLHGIWVRNNLLRYLYDEKKVEETPPSSKDIILNAIEEDPKNGLNELAKHLPTAYYDRFLDLLTRIFENDWKDRVISLFKDSEGRFTNECVNFLVEYDSMNGSKYVKKSSDEKKAERKIDEKETCRYLVKKSLEGWLKDQTLHGPVILWVVKNRNGKLADVVDSLIGKKLFAALLSAIDKEALLAETNRRILLADFLAEDRELVRDLLRDSSLEASRDLAQSLLLNQGFEDLSKKSILSRFINLHPEIQSLVATTSDSKAERLYVSETSLRVRREELEDIIKNQQPASKKAVEDARELGDLRENAEYKMAREHDEILSARRMQLERDIAKAEVFDFSTARDDVVGIGSVVELEKDGSEKLTCTIMGAWDSDPSKNIYSYKTPLAQALIDHSVGDTVQTDIEGHKTRWTILSIRKIVLK